MVSAMIYDSLGPFKHTDDNWFLCVCPFEIFLIIMMRIAVGIAPTHKNQAVTKSISCPKLHL